MYMNAAGTISDCVVDIGVSVVKDKIKNAHEEAQIRRRLHDYLDRQHKYNFNGTHEEEIDFQGLAEYICGDLLEEVKLRLLGNVFERARARQFIMDNAARYAQAKTSISAVRARKLVSDSIDILRGFYRSTVNRELKFIAAEIEDTVIDEMTTQHQSQEKMVEDLTKKVGQASILSIDHNISLIQGGNLDLVEENVSTFFRGISTVHTLPHDFRFGLNERGQMISIPLSDDALKRYPPRFTISAESVKIGDTLLTKIDDQTLSQAYRHQTPISFDVIAAKKYLGDIQDPAQAEAEEMAGTHVILYPRPFPKAFHCNVSIDGNVAVEYLLLRTKEILDDGTWIITNDEQKNFNFRVKILANPTSRQFSFSITPTNPTNYESLQYRLFLKKASVAKKIIVKALAENVEILSSGKINPFNFDQLDDEIEFLKKVTAIEHFFDITCYIPQELKAEDHFLINRLYSMIEPGVYHGKREHFNFTLEVSELSRSSINNMVADTRCSLAYADNVSVTLFGQTIEFPLLRRIDGAKIDNLDGLKQKVATLNDGDEIELKYIPADQDRFMTYSDAFYSEDTKSLSVNS